jgi:hypothetical protein
MSGPIAVLGGHARRHTIRKVGFGKRTGKRVPDGNRDRINEVDLKAPLLSRRAEKVPRKTPNELSDINSLVEVLCENSPKSGTLATFKLLIIKRLT